MLGGPDGEHPARGQRDSHLTDLMGCCTGARLARRPHVGRVRDGRSPLEGMEVVPSTRLALFLASTVSALHTNAHIWNASHPLLVTYYCRVTVYSPGMEAKKLNIKVFLSFSGFEPQILWTKTHTFTD